MRRLASLALFLALLSGPCEAALSIGTMGSNHQATLNTNALTTVTTSCPTGSLIVVLAGFTTIADSISSVSDGTTNTYTSVDDLNGTGISLEWAYSFNTANAVNTGSTITVTFNGTLTSEIGAVCIQGAATTAPLDVSNQSAQGTLSTAATAVNSGTLAQASEILLGGVAWPTTPGTRSCQGSGSGTWNSTTAGPTSTPTISICSQIVSSTSSVSFAPSWGTTNSYITDLVSFKAPGGGGASSAPLLTTLGGGP